MSSKPETSPKYFETPKEKRKLKNRGSKAIRGISEAGVRRRVAAQAALDAVPATPRQLPSLRSKIARVLAGQRDRITWAFYPLELADTPSILQRHRVPPPDVRSPLLGVAHGTKEPFHFSMRGLYGARVGETDRETLNLAAIVMGAYGSGKSAFVKNYVVQSCGLQEDLPISGRTRYHVFAPKQSDKPDSPYSEFTELAQHYGWQYLIFGATTGYRFSLVRDALPDINGETPRFSEPELIPLRTSLETMLERHLTIEEDETLRHALCACAADTGEVRDLRLLQKHLLKPTPNIVLFLSVEELQRIGKPLAFAIQKLSQTHADLLLTIDAPETNLPDAESDVVVYDTSAYWNRDAFSSSIIMSVLANRLKRSLQEDPYLNHTFVFEEAPLLPEEFIEKFLRHSVQLQRSAGIEHFFVVTDQGTAHGTGNSPLQKVLAQVQQHFILNMPHSNAVRALEQLGFEPDVVSQLAQRVSRLAPGQALVIGHNHGFFADLTLSPEQLKLYGTDAASSRATGGAPPDWVEQLAAPKARTNDLSIGD